MANKKQLLLIEDDISDQVAFKRIFWDEDTPYEYTLADSVSDARQIIEKKAFDVIVTDYLLGDGTGFDILDLDLDAPVIMTTGGGSEEVAVKAMKAGAFDYLIKDPDRNYLKLLLPTIEKALKMKKTEDRYKMISERESEEVVLIGSAGLAGVVELVERAASTDSPVLITGETGTGKTLVAKAIHYKSPMRSAPFVSINCAALPENIVESELFGYEKGAFTGAVTPKKGLFELAAEGTLFLDEIGEMPLHLQAKLLTAIEDKQIRRLGGESARAVNVRIMAATGTDPESALGKGLRKDLYYRLSVIRIQLPPLRERRADIPELCEHLLKKILNGRDGKMPEQEMKRLMAYDWPGNVREVRNVLERAAIFQKGPELRPSEFLPERTADAGACPAGERGEDILTMEEVEKEHIRFALQRFSGNITKTASVLGIPLTTFKRKIKEYGLKMT
ncbi:MAG: sigma-54-dependent Fis family transcriptional regulator [Nitrospirae bacterium]|nr:sigma-54-dependent Fis family transcriptional regulator [Nitrospirota bacterium]